MTDHREDQLYTAAEQIIGRCDVLIKAAIKLKLAIELQHNDFEVKVTPKEQLLEKAPATFEDHARIDAAAEFAKIDWQTLWNEHGATAMAERKTRLEERLRLQIEHMQRAFRLMPQPIEPDGKQ